MTKAGKVLKSCPLFIMMLSSVSLVMVVGFILTFYGKYEYNPSFDTPVFVAVVNGEFSKKVGDNLAEAMHGTLGDAGEIVFQEPDDREIKQEDTGTVPEIVPESSDVENNTLESGSGNNDLENKKDLQELEEGYISNEMHFSDGSVVIVPTKIIEFEKWNDNPPRSIYCDNPGVKPLTSKYDFVTMLPEDMSNTLFIGDSRMDGFHEYSKLPEATFLFKPGINIYALMSEELEVGYGGNMKTQKTKVEDFLALRQFENIYLSVGINELGIGTSKSFGEKYGQVLGQIRKLQPDARIIILSIMNVKKNYSTMPDIFNNDNINSRNAAIAPYANNKTIFYLDINPAVADQDGALAEENTFDGVHLKAQCYEKLSEYILQHGFKKNMDSTSPLPDLESMIKLGKGNLGNKDIYG